MNPDLIVEVVVSDANGPRAYATGYPISPGRIITAAHVVLDAQGKYLHENPQITVRFHGVAIEKSLPAELIWNGPQSAKLDVAVLSCSFPLGVTCDHHLPCDPIQKSGDWEARGFAAHSVNLNQPKYVQGPFPACSIGDGDKIVLECSTELVDSEGKKQWTEWQGASGEAVFLKDRMSDSGLPILAAILVEHSPGSRPDQFRSVPMWVLLAADGFKEAIEFTAVRRREDRLSEVVAELDDLLQKLTETAKSAFEKCLAGSPAFQTDTWGLQCAKHMIGLTPVAFAELIRDAHAAISEQCSADDRRRMRSVVDLVLPVRYSPETLDKVASLLKTKKAVVIEGLVARHCIAEIVMAGFDQRETVFIIRGEGEPVGKASLQLPTNSLPSGPKNRILATARDFLEHLAAQMRDKARLQVVRRKCAQSRQRAIQRSGEPNYAEEADLLKELLTDELADSSRGRTWYCAIEPGDPYDDEEKRDRQRGFVKSVIREITDRVPNLTFIELVLDEDVEQQERPFFRCVHHCFAER